MNRVRLQEWDRINTAHLRVQLRKQDSVTFRYINNLSLDLPYVLEQVESLTCFLAVS